MGTMGIFKHIVKKQKEALSHLLQGKRQRVDSAIPLGLKINSIVKIDGTKFIINEGKLKVLPPGPGTHTVVAAGKYTLASMSNYKLYLQSTMDKEDESIIQIVVDNTELISLAYYKVIDEIFPANEDEWGVWLNEGTGLIGYRDFIIEGELVYNRTVGSPAQDYIEPLEFTETVALDPYGETGMKIDCLSMRYARDVGINEYIVVTMEEVKDETGETTGAGVTIMAGIELSEPEIELT
ncbi:MAG: YjfK family protein [Candidatus Magnetominusculus sp. LBB02]|nr:YjfK family protein [Candidatus Magnetominusculus sp. LBB02]